MPGFRIRHILTIVAALGVLGAAVPAQSQSIWLPWQKQTDSARKIPATKNQSWYAYLFGSNKAQTKNNKKNNQARYVVSPVKSSASLRSTGKKDKTISDFEPHSAEELMQGILNNQIAHQDGLRKLEAARAERMAELDDIDRMSRMERVALTRRANDALNKELAKRERSAGQQVRAQNGMISIPEPSKTIYLSPASKQKPVAVFKDYK